MYCNNCGKKGHLYKECKLPVTSCGNIVFRLDKDEPEILMIQRKDSLCYIDFIRGKYDIKKDRVLAHSDISPSRKLDPGEKFDWRRLAKKDLAIWPNEIFNIPKELNSDQLLYNLLFKIGYDVKNHFKPSLVAFKRHFIQNDIDEDESELVINIAYSVYKAFTKVRSLY